jgi:hypothetical protein
MVKDERKTIRNKFTSSNTSKALLFGAKIKMAERYCARTIMGIL